MVAAVTDQPSKDLPAQVHDLVVAEARQRPAQRHLQPDHRHELHHEREEVDQHAQASGEAGAENAPHAADDRLLGQIGDRPSTEKDRRDDTRDHHDFDELGHVEEPEAHARVLEVVAGDDLRFALGDVEGRPLVLGHDGGEEHHEAERLQEDSPVGDAHPIEP
jgi:hypothetical protein